MKVSKQVLFLGVSLSVAGLGLGEIKLASARCVEAVFAKESQIQQLNVQIENDRKAIEENQKVVTDIGSEVLRVKSQDDGIATTLQKSVGWSDDSFSGFSEKYDFVRGNEKLNSFFNTVTPQEVTVYGALSKAIYQVASNPNVKGESDQEIAVVESKLARINLLLDQVDELEEKQGDANNKESRELKRLRNDLFDAIFDETQPTIEIDQDLITSIRNKRSNFFSNRTHLDLLKDSLIEAKHYLPQEIQALGDLGNYKLLLDQAVSRIDSSNKRFRTTNLLYRNGGVDLSGAILERGGYFDEKKEVLVVFKGSKTQSDWWSNLSFLGNSAKNDHLITVFTGMNLHGGMLSQYEEAVDAKDQRFSQILRKISSYPTGSVKVTTVGHSLGGALSTMAAYHFKHEAPKAEVRNVTFGSPRFANPVDARKFDKLLGKENVIRFWGYFDPVPAVVLGSLTNSKHVGTDVMVTDWRFRDAYKSLKDFLRAIPTVGGMSAKGHDIRFYANYCGEALEKVQTESKRLVQLVKTKVESLNRIRSAQTRLESAEKSLIVKRAELSKLRQAEGCSREVMDFYKDQKEAILNETEFLSLTDDEFDVDTSPASTDAAPKQKPQDQKSGGWMSRRWRSWQ